MSIERAAMRGRLEELKQKRARLRFSIEGTSQAICTKLNTLLTPPDQLEAELIDELWCQVKSAWAELQLVNADIARFERELN